MRRTFSWPLLLWLLAIALAFVVSLRSDVGFLQQVSAFSMQGSPAPTRDPDSPTGYVHGQRHFLGMHERGETYRWIAATQDVIAKGLFGEKIYEEDTVPTGRPSLLPRLFAWWLAIISWCLHLFTGESVALSVERAALWEPVISQVLAFAGAVIFMGRRFGVSGAATAAMCFAFFPPFSGQFVPGVLTARTWALFLAGYTIALSLPQPVPERKNLAFSKRSAVAASIALWLDPAFGFSAIVISVVIGAASHLSEKKVLPCLQWSLIGAGLTLIAWWCDGSPWSPTAGELRYLHPYYALAWLGLGLGLTGVQNFRSGGQTKRGVLEIVAATALISPLGYTQIKQAYPGWLYSSVWMRRITSLDETIAFVSLREWFHVASAAEIVFISAPLAVAAALLLLALWGRRNGEASTSRSVVPATILFAMLIALTFFRVRWGVLSTLVALPLIWILAARWKMVGKVSLVTVSIVFLLGLVAWRKSMPTSYQQPSSVIEPGTADLEALVHRHFAHWLAAHTPGQKVAALASPELSDSLVFHGSNRVLMSTAWESYPGQLAVNRILSALESTEAEAVIQGHELTHIILPSWDKVLPLFVQKPTVEGKDTLYDRLQRWVYPPFLRPIPYQLPPIPLFAAEKLAVFKVTPPQDEAYSLSRLAEYFVEMDRDEPALVAAQVLEASYPNDPNAVIARATVYAHVKKQAEFERELARLVAETAADNFSLSW
ncbi:MAG TPA: hypothetical protein VL069_02395, partial [Opitutus sp.]|nr:hypothetical protein [Opitutus sp.]